METKQKTFTVSIPEGKKAVWNKQGILQLEDDDKEANEPKDVTERIKTFFDALSELEQRAERGDCEARQLIDEYYSLDPEEASLDLLAYLQLRIIAAALNEGWEPQIDGWIWFPNFYLYTKKEIDEMSDDKKDENNLLLLVSSGDDGVLCGLKCLTDSCVYPSVCARFGYRLVYKTKKLATYAGRQFVSEHACFLLGGKVVDAIPWREYEQMRKSSDK